MFGFTKNNINYLNYKIMKKILLPRCLAIVAIIMMSSVTAHAATVSNLTTEVAKFSLSNVMLRAATAAEDVTYDDWTSSNHVDGSTESKSWTIELADAAMLSFNWLVSSESGYDYLKIYLDESVILERSGEESGNFSRRITAGSHTLRATYSKDGSGNNGSDQAKVFNISISGFEYAEIVADSIVTRSDVDLIFQNGGSHGWYHSGKSAGNANCGDSYSTALLSMSYQSEYKTELTFDWRCYNSSNHSLQLYIDGVYKGYVNNSSYESRRFYIDAGSHVVLFRDSIGNSTSTNNYSYIKNIKVKEILPLETAVLTENSKPLTFTNASEWPWTIEDGYIQNSNYGMANTTSSCSTTFTIDTLSVFSFDSRVCRSDGSSGSSSYQILRFFINNRSYKAISNSPDFTKTNVALEPGTYTIEFVNNMYNTTNSYISQIRNIELSSNWVDVELATSGTLGVEVLYKVNVLDDVELLKIKGRLNSTDWTNIKLMKNLVALDLTEAQFEALPDYAFDGLTYLSNVKFPEGMKTIGSSAFQGTQIQDIMIPSSVYSIGSYAFAETRLHTLVFADNSSINSIGLCAFKNCTSLTQVRFGDNSSLVSIGGRAFYGCTRLVEMIMPNSVSSIGVEAFRGCSSMWRIHFSNAINYIPQFVCYGCNNLSEVLLPQNLINIYNESFYNATSLRKIDFPNTIDRIDYAAFYGCGLDSVSLPVRMGYLAEQAFSNCSNLKYIELPSSLKTSSGTYRYSYYENNGNLNCYTTTQYYGYSNNFSNCSALETIIMRSATPPGIESDPFSNSRSKSVITLKVPSFAVVNYKLDSYWYQFGSIIEGDDVDYWMITSPLSLTNNRRMQGKPDIDLYYGGQFTVGGNAPMEVGQFNIYLSESNPGRLLNTCEAMTADSINSYFSVSSETWYFFTPLHDVDLTKVTVSNGASYVFRYYDGSSRATNGTGNSWRNVDSGNLVAGQGYIFRCNTNAVISFPAEASVHAQLFNTNDVTKSLNTYEAAASANKSWNFVGNPYPCYFDIYYMDFTAPITVWTGSTYKAYSIVDDNYALRPMQSFFVQKPDAVDNIIFHKEGRQLTSDINHAAAAPSFRAPSSNNRYFFDLQLFGDENADETRVVINNESKLDYEIEHDASKFMSFEPTVPQIFTIDDEGNGYAINERPVDNGTVKLAYYVGQSGFYTLSATRADGDIYLHDAQLNKTVNLMEQDYTFHSDATEGTNNARFTLSLNISGGDTTGIKGIEETEFGNGDYYDLQGRKVQPSVKKGIYIQNGRKVVK